MRGERMKRSLTLTALLVVALSTAACGGSEPQQSERAAPSQEKRAAPATESAAKESAPKQNAPEEGTPTEGPSRESARGGEGSEAAGLSVTTVQGERVNLGGQGDVTALYFMAGW
jgi:hypothetical protein